MMTDPLHPLACLPRHTLRRGGVALLLMAGVLGAATASPPSTEEMGVLFYSPAERVAIERARSSAETATEEAPTMLQLNGLVRRGGGKSTAWINNRPWPEGPLRVPRHATTVGASGVSVDGRPLRIGETLDLTTGQRSDFVAADAVRIRPPK